MNKYLTLEEAAAYLGTSEETIKRYIEKGALPVYKLERALRFKTEDLDALMSRNIEVLLVPGVRAVVTHSTKVEKWVSSWRIIINFQDTKESRAVLPFGPNNKFTEYYIFVTKKYLEDSQRLPGTILGAEKFALQYIKSRFDEAKDSNGERELSLIQEDSLVCETDRCFRGVQLNIPTSKEYKEYSIDMTSDGFFSMLPEVLARAIVFYVKKKDNSIKSYFAFGEGALDNWVDDGETDEDMVEKALAVIKEHIDNSDIDNLGVYTYEYLSNEFISMTNPDWWTKVLVRYYHL